MPRYPDETLPSIQMSLTDFTATAQQILRAPNADPRDFVQFVLAGRLKQDDGSEMRVFLNSRDDAYVPGRGEYGFKRDYDSGFGATRDMPFTAAMAVFPVASFADTLKKDNHIKGLAIASDGTELSVPLHKIPNVAIGKVQRRHITRIFFPRLYRQDASPAISGDSLAYIYDNCLRVALQEVIPEQLTHWPVTYAAAMRQNRGANGRFHFHTVDVRHDVLQDFATAFLARLDERDELRDAFFVHELRGTKGASTHNPNSARERASSLNDIMKFLDEDAIDPAQWSIDIALEVNVPGYVTHFLVAGFRHIVEMVLPNAEPRKIDTLLRSQKHKVDLAASLKDLGGFRTAPGSKGAADGVSYINVYCTEKSAVYQLFEGGLYRWHTARELLPGNLPKLLNEVEDISATFSACSQDNGLDGNARLEIRVSLLDALYKNRTFPQTTVDACIVAIPRDVWWGFKFFRLAAINYVLLDFRRAKAAARAFPHSLTLGAVMIHQLNALCHRPAEGNAESDLLETCCMHTAADGSDNDDYSSDEDTESYPTMYERGLYFLSDVVTTDKVFRIPNKRHMDMKNLAYLYRMESLSALQQAFNVPQVMLEKTPVNHTRISNRRTTTIDVDFVRDDNVVVPHVEFGLLDRGITIRPRMRPAGRDVDENAEFSDGAEPEGDIDTIMRKIWSQFPFDVFTKGPNKKASNADSHIIMNRRDGGNVTIDIFKTFDLSRIFTHVQAKTVDKAFWSGVLFDRFFPPKNARAQPRGKLQNFPYMGYYKTWVDIKGRMSNANVEVVRNALRIQWNQLYWVPFAASDRMWATKIMNTRDWTTHPSNHRGPSPHIAINCRFSDQGRIKLAPTIRSEDNGNSENVTDHGAESD